MMRWLANLVLCAAKASLLKVKQHTDVRNGVMVVHGVSFFESSQLR